MSGAKFAQPLLRGSDPTHIHLGLRIARRMMSNPQVLIIEDDKDVAELYDFSLRSSGIETEIIRKGEDALARLAATVPGIVLLDLKLSPHLSGADILYRIRSDQRLAKTRVIVITGHPDIAEREL
jgi:two-component system phosphate regulon response regulator PhoB